MTSPDALPPSLTQQVEEAYRVCLLDATKLVGLGDECDIWHVDTDGGHLVLRVSQTWRTVDELAWCHRLVAFVQTEVPEAVAPIATSDGDTLFLWEGRPVSLYSWIEGAQGSRENASVRDQAADLLARLHRTMLQYPDTSERPGHAWPGDSQRADLADAELDRTLSEAFGSGKLLRAPIHGDYYPRNLIAREGRVAAVVDWDDAHLDVLIQELAWAVWEFAHDADGVRLHLDRARAFLAVYVAAGGPVVPDEHALIVPFIRRRLRAEVRHALDEQAQAHGSDDDYTEREIEAFHALARWGDSGGEHGARAVFR